MPASDMPSGPMAADAADPHRLHDGEARLRSIFSAMSEGLVIHGPDGRVIDANPAAAPILGLTQDQLLGRTSMDPAWQAVHEDGTPWPGEDHPAMVSLRTGREQRLQIMGVSAPGLGRRWISINASPLWGDASGKPTGAVATFNDVTPRLELKQRMERTESALTDLYDRAPCGYHSLDAEGRYQRINETELAWLGCRREEVVGRLSPTDFLTEETRQTFAECFPRIRAGEALQGLELELVGRQGERRRVSLSATVIRGEAGEFLGTRSILYDVTRPHRVALALEQSHAEQAHLLDNDLVGLVKVRERRFTWVNRGTERIFGYSAGELVGASTRLLYASDADFDAMPPGLGALRRAGAPFRAQLPMRRKNGQTVWIDLNSTLLSQDSGESLAVFVDITPMKLVEEMHRQAIELEAQNTALVDALRLKNLFVANMSHELRTPLNAVIGFAQLMRGSTYDRHSPRYAAHLGRIEASGRHLLRLIDTMLDFAQAESGRIAVRPEPVDLARTTQEVVGLLLADGERAGVTVHMAIDPGLTVAVVDPTRLRQILFNLVGNAIKFSRAGGRVDVRLSAEGEARFRIEVEDRGIGIAEADLPKLFAPFGQLSTGLARAYDGAGLGLALVHRLVEAQGGDVQVRSVLGQGSTFTVTLPLHPGAA